MILSDGCLINANDLCEYFVYDHCVRLSEFEIPIKLSPLPEVASEQPKFEPFEFVVVWDDDSYSNNPYEIRRFKAVNDQGRFETWWVSTEDSDDFDTWDNCVRLSEFKG